MSLTAGRQILLGGVTPAVRASISRSLRFNSADSAYLSRTPGSAGNSRIFTISFWLKRSKLGVSYQSIFGSDAAATGGDLFSFLANDTLAFWINGSSSGFLITTQNFRDVSAWYHFIFAIDTTQATASNRVKFYVNGSQITDFSTASYPAQNYDFASINTTKAQEIGRGYSQQFDGYLADFYFCDGSALTPSSFGEFDTTTGVWQPLVYNGSYGTNGFHLDFADNSNTTSTTLGKDTSGKGNNWTPNNFSVTAGAGNDSLVDVPTNGTQTDTGAGGEVRGNYPTFNSVWKSTNTTLSNGNLDCSSTGVYIQSVTIALPDSGKWYCEFTCTGTASGYPAFGILDLSQDPSVYSNPDGSHAAYFVGGGTTLNSGSGPSLSSFTTNDIIGVAYDSATRKVWFAKNGTWQNSGNPAAGTGQIGTLNAASRGVAFGMAPYQAGTGTFNGGQRAFAYAAPSGFKALCTANLPAPTIVKPSSVMDAVLWTGNGTSQAITTGFSPDLVWLKGRSNAYNHRLADTVRGASIVLYSDSTVAEGTESSGLTSFTSTGFEVGSSAAYNNSSSTFVGWAWDAGTSNATNTSGTITSTVRANISAGFSIVSYTATGSAGTIGHGLGVAPQFIVVKQRSANGNNWAVYHASLGATNYLMLSSTNASAASSSLWNNTAPTSTVFSVNNDGRTNDTGTYIAYCWAPVAGYSAFGSYSGTGTTDGRFVYTGFRPRWIMTKTTNGINHWDIYDAARNTYNVANNVLKPNLANAESTLTGFDLLSNGFKARGTDSENNGSGDTYIYAAFAESPFQYARAR